MKNKFLEFSQPDIDQYSSIWKDAVFIFDTNVLLNLYRFRASTREDLLGVLEKLSPRIWLPHHAALEFQRNRLKVLASQIKLFSDVRKSLAKAKSSLVSEIGNLKLDKRHSLIDATPFMESLEGLVSDFQNDLDKAYAEQQKVHEADELRSRLEKLFEGRVGDAPESQIELDKLYEVAKERYKCKIPPGYEDVSKVKDDEATYSHRGLLYRKEYGDYLVWNQILAHLKSSESKYLVFVTSDEKEDWWQRLDADGPKTIGPRVELIDEALRIGGVKGFLMYNIERFLENSKSFVQATVSQGTIEEVREIAALGEERLLKIQNEIAVPNFEIQAVVRWFSDKYRSVAVTQGSFPDFLYSSKRGAVGVSVIDRSDPEEALASLLNAISITQYPIAAGKIDEIQFVFVTAQLRDAIELEEYLRNFSHRSWAQYVVYIGVLDRYSEVVPTFKLYAQLS
jgi:hypothetical protein